jgi:hypothetical protein
MIAPSKGCCFFSSSVSVGLYSSDLTSEQLSMEPIAWLVGDFSACYPVPKVVDLYETAIE